mmetsp:Transcript_3722/g.9015  ORF Transcript_3722/g.9015 Transcript_3722/m.9015 type:complete len:2275 (-) Transcript_3722:103-6927(-)
MAGATAAEAEINREMQNIRKDWKETVAEIQSKSVTEPPRGLSRSEVQEWKLQEGKKAKERLKQLEDRLTRLQILRGKLRQLKATAAEAATHLPELWVTDDDDVPTMDEVPHQRHGATYPPQPAARRAWTEGPSGAADTLIVGTPADGMRRAYTEGPRYSKPARPMTPGTVRNIIREEVGSVLASPLAKTALMERSRESLGEYSRESLGGTGESERVRDAWQEHEVPNGKNVPVALPVAQVVAFDDAAKPHGAQGVDGVYSEIQLERPDTKEQERLEEERLEREAKARQEAWEKSEAFRLKYLKEPRTIDEAVEVSCKWLFGGFSRKSVTRLKCFDVYKSPSWSTFFLVVTMANSIFISILPEISAESASSSFSVGEPRQISWLDSVDVASAVVLFFEILVGCIALGFWGAPTTWMRSSDFHKLDMFVLLVTISEYILAFGFGITGVTMRPFRLLRVFRAITTIRAFSGIKTIIITLKQGLSQLVIVFAMLIFFCTCFAIFGMAVFQNSFSRRCVSLAHPVPMCSSDSTFSKSCNLSNFSDPTFVTEDQLIWEPGGESIIAGAYPWEEYCDTFAGDNTSSLRFEYPYDEVQGLYHTCGLDVFRDTPEGYGGVVYQTCEVVGNPGFAHYDHIGGAMLSVFQSTSGDGSYDVLWRMLQSEPAIFALSFLYFFVIIAMNTFLLLGLFVAVVTGTFSRVRQQHGSAFLSHEEEETTASAYSSSSSPRKGMRGIAGGYLPNITNALEQNATKKGQLKHPHLHHHSHNLRSRPTSTSSLRARTPLSLGEDDPDDNLLQRYALRFMASKYFQHFFSLTIILNLVAAAADQPDTTPEWREFARWTYYVCCGIFWLELMIRFTAASSFAAFQDESFHKFEFVVNIVTLAGLTNPTTRLELIACLRMYRLMVYLPTLQALLVSALASVSAIMNLVVFLLVVAITFNVTGRYLFGRQMDDLTRSNFGSFQEGLITIFQILTGDSWSGVLYASMSTKASDFGQVFAAFFISGWFTFANVIVYNLFIAVIIENFQVKDTIEHIKQPGRVAAVNNAIATAYGDMVRSSQSALQGKYKVNPNTGETRLATQNDFNHRVPGSSAGGAKNNNKALKKKKQAQRARAGEIGEVYEMRADLEVDRSKLAGNTMYAEDRPDLSTSLMQVLAGGMPTEEMKEKAKSEVEVDEPERVLGCLGPKSRIRRFFAWLGKQVLFDVLVYTSIIASCVFLVLTPPNPDAPGAVTVIDLSLMELLNQIFTIIFTVEFLVRITGQGLYFTKNAYLSSGWNVTDFVVLFFAWIELTQLFPEGSVLRIARLARSLRPLRLMKRNAGMRVVIDALLSTMIPVSYVFLFAVFTFVVFALIGQGLFGGKMSRCQDAEPGEYGVMPGTEFPGGLFECVGQAAVSRGFLVPRAWITPTFNFDTTYNSMITLFRINTIKYVGIIYDAMDITGPDTNPSTNATFANALFFILYLFIGGLFVMNLFVGFIIDGFNANKGSSDADIFYGRFGRQIATYKPKYDRFKPPRNAYSALLRVMILSNRFELFSGSCVVINLCFMLSDHANPQPWFVEMMFIQNTVFFGELCFEVLLNVIAFGPGGFLNDIWKAFDLFVCVGSSISYVANSAIVGQFAKTFRILRVIRLMKMIKPIRVIMETLIICLPQLVNIIILLILVYSMFAVVAVEQFGMVKNGTRIGPTANFFDWPFAMMTVFQIITGDEWQDMMADMLVTYPSCTQQFNAVHVHGWHDSQGWAMYRSEGYTFGDCGSVWAPAFFIPMFLVCTNIMLNLFIGMILDNFSFITDDVGGDDEADSNWNAGSSSEQIQALSEVFKRHDAGTGNVSINCLHILLCDMQLPLGFRDPKGHVTFGGPERAAELLIRAECNVHIRTLRLEAQAKRDVTLRMWLARKLGCGEAYEKMLQGKPDYFNCQIGFEDLMRIMLYWRKPDMVPPNVLVARHERCEEVLMMAQALVIKDFFSMLVGKRKQRKTGKVIQDRIKFNNWAKEDPHRRRWEIQRAQKGTDDLEALADTPFKTLADAQLPTTAKTTHIPLNPVEYPPDETIQHQDALLMLRLKYPKPMHGIEVFIDRCKRDLVVMKFIDPVNEKWGPLIGDFSQIDWQGWVLRNQSHDSYWEPYTHNVVPGKHGQPWMRVDIQLAKQSVYQTKVTKFGSLLDIVSCVASEASTEGGTRPTNPTSLVRLNMGKHHFLIKDPGIPLGVKGNKATNSAVDNKDDFVAGVLEVIGYLQNAAGKAEEEEEEEEGQFDTTAPGGEDAQHVPAAGAGLMTVMSKALHTTHQ